MEETTTATYDADMLEGSKGDDRSALSSSLFDEDEEEDD
jgi:hypothetical protein